MSADGVAQESVVARLRPHARALFWPTVALVVVAAAVGYFYGQLPERWENLALLGLAAVLALLLWLIPVVAWLGRNYTITSRRVIVRGGLGIRVRQELLLSRAFDVTVRSRGLQVLFRTGDVQLNAAQELPVTLRDVPRAKLVQAALHDLIEAVPRQDG